MILFPNCKINLGLNVIRKRPDGYHDLQTFFYPLPLTDILELIPSGKSQFRAYGIPVPGDEQANLCLKARRLLAYQYSALPQAAIYLYKNIPVGAGLGGGSADGAFMLRAYNVLFQLGMSAEQLMNLAIQLGSDCPFFMLNQSCFATGRGELLELFPLDLSDYSFVLVHGGIHIDTGWAFSQMTPDPAARDLKKIIQLPLPEWRSVLQNDFEAPVLSRYPQLREIPENLYEAGAIYASMTGSGSSFFGIFKKNATPSISFAGNFMSSNIK